MTDQFFGEFRSFLISGAKERDFDGPNLDLTVASIDELYMLPSKELIAWFCDKGGVEWETLFDAMINCISNYIATRNLADSK